MKEKNKIVEEIGSFLVNLLKESRIIFEKNKSSCFEYQPSISKKTKFFEINISSGRIKLNELDKEQIFVASKKLYEKLSPHFQKEDEAIIAKKIIKTLINSFDAPIAIFLEKELFISNKEFKKYFNYGKKIQSDSLFSKKIDEFLKIKHKRFTYYCDTLDINCHLVKFRLFDKKAIYFIALKKTAASNFEQVINFYEKKRSLYAEVSPIAIIELNRNYEISYANPKARELFDYSQQELKGINFFNLLNETGKKEALEAFEKCQNTRQAIEAKLTAIAKNKKELIIEWKFNSLTNEKGELQSFLCLGEDITQKEFDHKINLALYKISEAASRAEDLNELYKSIHNTIRQLMKAQNFYIAIADDERKYIDFPYFIDEFEPPPSREPFRNGLTENVILKGEPLLVKFDNNENANQDIEIIGPPCKVWLGIPLKIGNSIFGVMALQDYYDSESYGKNELETLQFVSEQISFAIFRKISEQKLKNYARELEENKKLLEEKNKELETLNFSLRESQEELKIALENKDKFFSIFSHDLKNPFMALLGFSEFLLSYYKELNDSERLQYIENIYSSSRNIYDLLDNLLKWAKYELGTFEQRPEYVSLFDISNKVISLLSFFANKKNIKIKNNLMPDCFAYADPNAVFSIMQNLISNAIKFSPSNGEIFIEYKKDDKLIYVSVLDYGIGILQDDIDKILSLKTHYSTPGTMGEKGAGLGLSMAKIMTEKNGGSIVIESEKNKYCKITFSLPLYSN